MHTNSHFTCPGIPVVSIRRWLMVEGSCLRGLPDYIPMSVIRIRAHTGQLETKSRTSPTNEGGPAVKSLDELKDEKICLRCVTFPLQNKDNRSKFALLLTSSLPMKAHMQSRLLRMYMFYDVVLRRRAQTSSIYVVCPFLSLRCEPPGTNCILLHGVSG